MREFFYAASGLLIALGAAALLVCFAVLMLPVAITWWNDGPLIARAIIAGGATMIVGFLLYGCTAWSEPNQEYTTHLSIRDYEQSDATYDNDYRPATLNDFYAHPQGESFDEQRNAPPGAGWEYTSGARRPAQSQAARQFDPHEY